MMNNTLGQEEGTLFNCANKIEPLKCHQCSPFKTYKLVHLTNHLKAGHTLFKFEEKLYKCRRCNFQTGSKFLSLRHKSVKPCSRIGTIRTKKADSNTLKWFKCNECSYETLGPSLLEIHMKLKHPRCKKTKTFKCEIRTYYKTSNSNTSEGNLSPESPSVKSIEKQQPLRFLHCNYCPYKVKSEARLKEHENAHNNFHKCKYCPFAAKSRQHVSVHMRKKHVNHRSRTKFKCSHCSFETNHKHSLKCHTLTQHTEEEKVQWFECEHCSYQAKTLPLLNQHLKYKHTIGDDYYKCDYCSFETKYKFSLESHTLTQHTEKEKVQWFKCEHCSYQSKRLSLLNQHLKNKHTYD